MIQPEVQRMQSEIDDVASKLGPLAGRWSEVMTGRVGADNPAVAGLQMDLKLFATALMLAHGLKGKSYEESLSQYLSLAQSPDNLKERIANADKWLLGYAAATGHGEASKPATSPEPTEKRATRDDVQSYATQNKVQYSIAEKYFKQKGYKIE
jgi:hypothetical protein